MANEELKEEIIKFLKQKRKRNPDRWFSVTEIHKMLNTSVTYATIWRYVDLLIAAKRVEVQDYGNLKTIRYKKE